VSAVAVPGGDMKLQDWVAFYWDGSFGIGSRPNIWHETLAPVGDRGMFYGKQGRVHARISRNFAEEFGHFLSIPLSLP